MLASTHFTHEVKAALTCLTCSYLDSQSVSQYSRFGADEVIHSYIWRPPKKEETRVVWMNDTVRTFFKNAAVELIYLVNYINQNK